MTPCFYCEQNEKLKSIMIKITDLPWSTVYLNRNQALRGRCIVAYKEHKTEYFQLSPDASAGFFADVSLTAQVIKNIFNPDKINYATYGDLVPHAHFHVVPKYAGKVHWGGPFADEPRETLSDAEYEELVGKIRSELDRLSKTGSLMANVL